MKKKLLLISLLLILTGCIGKRKTLSEQDRYLNLIDLVNDQEILKDEPQTFSLQGQAVKVGTNQYRYYVLLNKPLEAMYYVSILACQEGVDYRKVMAPSVGVLEESSYHLVPNQVNIKDGYVRGLTISGLSNTKDINLRILVKWEKSDHTDSFREFYKLNLKAED